MYFDRKSPEWNRLKVTFNGKPVKQWDIDAVCYSPINGSFIEVQVYDSNLRLSAQRKYGLVDVEITAEEDRLAEINHYISSHDSYCLD